MYRKSRITQGISNNLQVDKWEIAKTKRVVILLSTGRDAPTVVWLADDFCLFYIVRRNYWIL